ncbi:CASP-like protein [Apostasia shenzhenica]|uniref:CASP-like protein n=1 Tax=Apostasia shenzhenica TaxID=1088818 RepID=A0A2I0B3A0_9ASPA|nr:CASP-like protein [Apostasia shenzhenica]
MAPMMKFASEGGDSGAADRPTWQETQSPAVAVRPPASFTMLVSCILRSAAVVLTLVATIVMGVAKETVTVDGGVDPNTGADYTVEGKVKSTYNSSFVYFIIVNALTCVYSAVSAGVSFINQRSSATELPVAVADVVAAILIFTANAAATAIEIVAQKGNSHFGWDKFCNYTKNFCGHLTAAIVLSTFAAVAYALLLVLSMISLQKKSR